MLVADTNHNRYNTVWWDDAVSGVQPEDYTDPGLLDVTEHQRILTSFGAGFFQRTLLGLVGPERVLTGRARPVGVRNDKVRLCHSIDGQVVVD